MAISKGVVAALVLGAGASIGVIANAVSNSTVAAAPAKPRGPAPKDAKHLWVKQVDGGTLIREPLPTLDDGGCQAWAQRCADGKCKGACE